MDVLPTTEITPAMLVNSNAPALLPGQSMWSTQAWAAGSVVAREETRRIYRAVYDVPSGGVPPEQNIADAQLPYWQEIGAMNQWAMFDGQMRTQTLHTGDLIVVLRPGSISSAWVGNVRGVYAIRVIVRDGPDGNTVYDEIIYMQERTTTYWDWWFAPFRLLSDAIFSGIPAYRDCEVEIMFSGPGEIAVGMTAVGAGESWGITEWGVDADFQNYSTRNLNSPWGPSQPTGGEVTKDITYRVFVKPEDAPRVDKSLKSAMKRPAIYMPSGQPEFEGIRIFGQAISARLGYPHFNYVPLDITIREFL